MPTLMEGTLKPRDIGDVEAAVKWALGDGKSLDIVGQGSKRAIGRPAQHGATLDLTGLTGITLYEPQELVISAPSAARSPRTSRGRGGSRLARRATISSG